MIVRSILFTLLVFTTACCSSKKSSANATQKPNEAIMTDAKMMEAGFKSGTIVASKIEGDCQFTIEMTGEKLYFLDPINLEEQYKKDGMEVWFTFTGLRMMNRCEKANPINVNEIQMKK
ncbi:hypothetical protein [Patiriisocius sp. Uisw_017]|jgi:hypothetical protein|uniref:hypothetical protein n=1 Tax=Patiriisocius sp. Uisw_017 TaxID=3230968 RepID=UPI0039ECF78F